MHKGLLQYRFVSLDVFHCLLAMKLRCRDLPASADCCSLLKDHLHKDYYCCLDIQVDQKGLWDKSLSLSLDYRGLPDTGFSAHKFARARLGVLVEAICMSEVVEVGVDSCAYTTYR